MLVIPSVVGRRRVWKYHVVGDVVLNNATDVERLGIKSLENRRRTRPEIAQDSYDSDPQNIIAEAAPVWPTPGDSSITEAWLYRADQRISSEDTESIKTRSSC
jgi:hypothetical protein